MTIVKCILISFLAHGLLMWISWPKKEINVEQPSKQFEIVLTKNEPLKLIGHSKNKMVAPLTKYLPRNDLIIKKPFIKHNNKKLQKSLIASVNKIFSENAVLQMPILEDLILNEVADHQKYYATNEVDIKALPINNIDASLVEQFAYTSMPLKLRLFINVNGRIDRVENLSVLEQDEEFFKKIEQLLKETTFLPARKESVNVDSFQDVEFSF